VSKKQSMQSLQRQVGGDHYQAFAIQPAEFIAANNLSFLKGSIIKYVCRYRLKGAPVEDARKAVHYAEMLLEATLNEYGDGDHS
jgi:hypothetical protein